MKWSEQQITKLKDLCYQGISNKEIAAELNCSVGDVYAKRSQMGITIDKCKGVKPNSDFEKALPQKHQGLCLGVRKAFKALQDELLLAMAREWTSERDSKVYAELVNLVNNLETSFNALIAL